MKYRFTIIILAIMALAGCKKDNLASIPEGAIRLTTENHQGTKTSVSGTSIQWVGGDEVKLAGIPYTVAVNDTIAYVENFARPSTQYFFNYYPASLTASETFVTVPSLYESSFVGGRQILKQPLVARTPRNSETIRFLYVTSSVQVLIKNTTGTDLIVDRVEVSSATQQLCGPCGISFDGSYNLTVTPKTSGIADNERKVSVVLTGDTLVVTSGGNPVEVQVPILPVGEGNLTVSVYARFQGAQPGFGYTFSRALPNPAIARNELMTARVLFNASSPTMGPYYSVSEDTKVIFAQGNLQYHATGKLWRFAIHQYDRIGAPNSNISSTYSDWIDLFGYGTSGNTAQPYETSTSNQSTYPYPQGNIAGTSSDWGVRNPITNGGNQPNLWRTLTISEWTYLLNTRSASTVSGVANARYAIACVNGQNGLILFPDLYSHQVNVDLSSYINQPNVENWNTLVSISLSDWTVMESAGVAFLPAAGYREGTEVGRVDLEGNYWSSTFESGTARRVMFGNSNNSDFSNINGVQPHVGYSVRLARNVSVGN